METLLELRRLATTGEHESLIIVIPDPPSSGVSYSWAVSSPKSRRQAESEAASDSTLHTHPDLPMVESPPSPLPLLRLRHAKSDPISACFDSLDACNAATANCSSRGDCRNRWARGEEDEVGSGKACFACHCKVSQNAIHYGGAVCDLVDVSTPFWLLTGSAVALIFFLTAAVGMLFAVGEEPLPGILSAGVSRSNT